MSHPRIQADGAIITSAVFVGAVWSLRKVMENGKLAGEVSKSPTVSEGELRTLVGLAKQAPSAEQFLVGYGFVFFTLAIVAQAAPDPAKWFAALVAVGTGFANAGPVLAFVGSKTAPAKSAGVPKPTPASGVSGSAHA
jgi:hypothetical protein